MKAAAVAVALLAPLIATAQNRAPRTSVSRAADAPPRAIEARESYLSFESCPAWQPLRDDDEGRRMLDAVGP